MSRVRNLSHPFIVACANQFDHSFKVQIITLPRPKHLLQEAELPFSKMANLQTKHNWVSGIISYDSIDTLMDILKEEIIGRAIKNIMKEE